MASQDFKNRKRRRDRGAGGAGDGEGIGERLPFKWIGTLGLIVLVVFWPAFKIPFLLDDYQIYLDHWPAASWGALGYDVLHHFQQNRILTHLSWYVQLILHGPTPSPGWFHGVNLLMHWVNALLVFLFVRKLGASIAVGMLTSAMFAVHPSNMEAVSYIYGRSDLQVTAFLLGGLILLKDSPRRLVPGLACAVCAVLTKETAVVLPALYVVTAAVLRAETYPFRKSAFAAAVLAALIAVAGFAYLKTDHADNFGFGFPNADRYVMLQPFCLLVGLIRMIAPFGYSIVYQFDLPTRLWDFRVAGPLIFWAVLAYFCVRQFRAGRRIYLFALGWYLSAMAPTNSVIPRIDQLSDRHLYLALIGPLWALSASLEQTWIRYGGWIKTCSWAAVVIFGGLTVAQNIRWQSAVDLWKTAVDRYPAWALARRELAGEYGRAGQPLKELEQLEAITRQWPADWTSWNNLGIAYAAQGMRLKEQESYRQAIHYAPPRHKAIFYHNLGLSFQIGGQTEAAIEAYYHALEWDSKYIGSKHNLALLLWQKGDTYAAGRYLREVLAVNPHHEMARRNLEILEKSKNKK